MTAKQKRVLKLTDKVQALETKLDCAYTDREAYKLRDRLELWEERLEKAVQALSEEEAEELGMYDDV